MNKDTLVLAFIGLTLIIAAVVTYISKGTIPSVIEASVTLVIGAIAGGAYASRDRGNDARPPTGTNNAVNIVRD